MKFRLRVLGGLALDVAEEPLRGVEIQRRPLALLAILAAARDQGIARERIFLYLWPESDTRRARNSLNQTLYALRRDLGEDDVVLGTNSLRLNPALVSSDAWEFEAALATGQLDEAVALHSGPFLDGFGLLNLPELEQWIEEERARLMRAYRNALEALAFQAGSQGQHRLAVDRWRRLAALQPLSAPTAFSLMQALVASGDRSGALEYAKAYGALIREDLDAPPDPLVTAFADQLRRPAKPADSAPAPLDPAAAGEAPQPSRTRSRPFWRVRPHRWAALAVLGLGLVGLAGDWWWSARGTPDPASEKRLVVLPFGVTGSPDAEYLGTGLVDLLTTSLDGAGEIRSVDPQVPLGWLAKRRSAVTTPEEAGRVAARFGAGLYVLGHVTESDGQLQLQAAMYDRRHGGEPVARAAVAGPGSRLFDLVNQLTTQLLAERYQLPRERLAGAAAATTTSVTALKSYLAGEGELRAGRYVGAADAFRRAVALDTTFALAYYRLSIAAEWGGQDSVPRAAAESAARNSARLPQHDRLLVEALAAWRRGRSADAERLYRRVVDDYPDDVEAWFQLGEVLFHSNPLRGRSATRARPAFERALALDPDNQEALVHLARIAFIEGRRQEVDTLVHRVLELAPSTDVLELRAFRAFALGDRGAQKRATRELLENPLDLPRVTALQVAVYLDDLDGAERFARLLRGERYSSDVRGLAYRLLARVAVARGQWAVARAQLDTAEQFDSTAALELRSLFAVLPFLRVPRSDVLAIRKEVEEWRPDAEETRESSHLAAHAGLHPYLRLYRLGLLNAQLGDTPRALRYARALDRPRESPDSVTIAALHAFVRSILARVALEADRPAEALSELEAANWEPVASVFEIEALDRYNRGELLHALSRDQEALDWYGSMAERAAYELVYLAPSEWRRGEIYEQLGDRDRAMECYRAVVHLWGNADPSLQTVVAEASRRLARP